MSILLALLALMASGSQTTQETSPGLLVFSHSTGWRHASIPAGVEALEALGEREGFRGIVSEDPDVFSPDSLAGIDVVLLLNTTSDAKKQDSEWFTGERRAAFQTFVRRGGGVVGIHGASDSHYGWPWYGAMIGGRFESHPEGLPMGTLTVVDADDPSTTSLPRTFDRVDEWYYIQDFDPRVHLLLTVDPASIGETDVNPNPISWRHEHDGGRVFYTAMGHSDDSYQDPFFLDHVAGGLRWAAGLTEPVSE